MEIERLWFKYPGWFKRQPRARRLRLLAWYQLRPDLAPQVPSSGPPPGPARVEQREPPDQPRTPGRVNIAPGARDFWFGGS